MVGFKQSIHFLVASRSTRQPYTSYLHDQPHASPTSHLAQHLRSCAEFQSDHDDVAWSNGAFSPTGASAGWSTDDRIGPQCLVKRVRADSIKVRSYIRQLRTLHQLPIHTLPTTSNYLTIAMNSHIKRSLDIWKADNQMEREMCSYLHDGCLPLH
ncbi:hypothetical protein Hypma_010783 [Hypsizygus marmoreus]|uniref:Uncharacterized protein n=1 Tax=Hypsizygus marmoreus TaxID=39966 RepID=A0A369JMZ7_HYPMA|nr:hypothetical protein Hypma_010783 [Hypsizygus marmoreus]